MKKRIFYGILIVALLVVSGLLAGKICRAKFVNDSTTIINGFYEEEKNDLNAIFIGSSNCFCTIDPVTLYEEYGIKSYDFCSSSQPMSLSLLYLKEALKTQNPKVVVLEVNMMMRNKEESLDEAGLRWGYTDMPLSINKAKSLYDTLGKVDGTYMSYLFPVLRYHERWSELTKSDYTYMFEDKWNPTKGYLRSYSVTETPIDFNAYYTEKKSTVPKENIEILNEMVSICIDNGTYLMLYKSPKAGWYQSDTEAIQKLADERRMNFVDYNTLVGELGIDSTADFRDQDHLNNSGAKKVTMHMGAYLVEQYDLKNLKSETTKNDSFERAVTYKQRTYDNQIPHITELAPYLEALQGMNDLTVAIAIEGNSGSIDDQAKALLKNFGVEQDDLFAGGHWVLKNNTLLFCSRDMKDYAKSFKYGDSELQVVKKENIQTTYLDGEEYHLVDNGINIIVYDNITGEIADAVGFDSFQEYMAVR